MTKNRRNQALLLSATAVALLSACGGRILRVGAGAMDFDPSFRPAQADALGAHASVGLFPLADTRALIR